MSHDDDLPVLTQVLRTGAGQDAPSWRPSLPEFDDAFDFRPIEYALTLRQDVADAGSKEDAGAGPADAAADTPVLRDVITVANTGGPAPDQATNRVAHGAGAGSASSDAVARRDADGLGSTLVEEPSQADAGGADGAYAVHDRERIAEPQQGHSHEPRAHSDDSAAEILDASHAPVDRDREPPDATTGGTAAHAARPPASPVVPEIVADPRRLGGRDAFALPQDTDLGAGGGNDVPGTSPSFDTPPLALESNDPALEPAGHDTPLHFPLRSLAERVRVAVYDDLTSRIRTELDARIAQAMHVEVENALAQMQDRLRVQLTDALRDVVGRAVDEEIARIEWSAATRDTPP